MVDRRLVTGVRQGRQENERHITELRMRAADTGQHIIARHAWHRPVAEDEVRLDLQKLLQPLFPVRRLDNVMALDAQLIEQALMNIVKNGMEAIEAAGQARGTIRLELVNEGARVRLSVVDSGDLLAAGPARPLFTPFFTTRKGGQGIGLMFVREVLQRHGCTYSLAPGAPGETRFDIWFPAP